MDLGFIRNWEYIVVKFAVLNICFMMSRPKLPPLKERVTEVADTEIREAASAKPRKKKKIDNGTLLISVHSLLQETSASQKCTN